MNIQKLLVSTQIAEEYGITSTAQIITLMRIADTRIVHSVSSLCDFADHSSTEYKSVSGIVRKLKQGYRKGDGLHLIENGDSVDNSRSKFLVLSERGEELISRIREIK